MGSFNKFFDNGWEKKINSMEKRKLIRLENERDELWREGNNLENERKKLIKNLIPNNLEALEQAKADRDSVLLEISQEIKELKEKRKQIYNEFREKTSFIRAERREQLKSDSKLKENKRLKDIVWEKLREKSNESHKYYTKLLEKYSQTN